MQLNLLKDKWIQVKTKENKEELVSINDILKHAKFYKAIKGDSAVQDLTILRLLEAILTAYYTKKNTAWKNIDNFEESMAYIKRYETFFTVFGEHDSLLNVSKDTYNQFARKDKQVESGKSEVAVKLINRNINESNNSPSVYKHVATVDANKITKEELARWLVTYQQYTGTVTKNKSGSYKISSGWMNGIDPIMIQGKNLFETLKLNLVLEDTVQNPLWEQGIETYVNNHTEQEVITNASELYTSLSRLLYITWDNEVTPHILELGLPKLGKESVFAEKMTLAKKDKDGNVVSITRNVKNVDGIKYELWHKYSDLTDIASKLCPQNVQNAIKNGENTDLTLREILYVKDANASSQLPSQIISKTISLPIELTRNPIMLKQYREKIITEIEHIDISMNYYYKFLATIKRLEHVDSKESINDEFKNAYQLVGDEFVNWINSLKLNNKDLRVDYWRKLFYRVKKQIINQTSVPYYLLGEEDLYKALSKI